MTVSFYALISCAIRNETSKVVWSHWCPHLSCDSGSLNRLLTQSVAVSSPQDNYHYRIGRTNLTLSLKSYAWVVNKATNDSYKIYNFSINTAPCSRLLTDLVPVITDNSVNFASVLTVPWIGHYSALGPLRIFGEVRLEVWYLESVAMAW